MGATMTKMTEQRIKETKDYEHSLSEKIKIAEFEIEELQEYVSNLRIKQGRAQSRLMKLMGASIQRNLRSSEMY
jgi:hypothetical protein